MPTVQKSLNLRSKGRGTIDVTARVAGVVSDSGIKQGLCNVFLQQGPHQRSVVVTVIG